MARKRRATRKRTTRKGMRRRTSRRAYTKKRVGNKIKSQWGKISAGAGALSALSLITSHDMSASTGQPIGVRAKNFVNSLNPENFEQPRKLDFQRVRQLRNHRF